MTGVSSPLRILADATADAVATVLASWVGDDQIEIANVTIIDDETSAFSGIEYPCRATIATYTNGMVGGNVFFMSPRASKAMALAMTGAPVDLDDDAGTVLSDDEIAALSEVTNQMMVAAAASSSDVVGDTITTDDPVQARFENESDVAARVAQASYATVVTVEVHG